jgi:hypothetical protein
MLLRQVPTEEDGMPDTTSASRIDEDRRLRDDEQIIEATHKILFWVLLAGAGGMIGLALWTVAEALTEYEHPRTSAFKLFGIYVLIAGAAAAAGSLFGFLFGMPRTRDAANAAVRGEDPNAIKRAVLIANTNLERVSDWLTALLLGATLVQIKDIAGWVAGLGRHVVDDPTSTVTTVLVVYFLVLGFLGTYLVTRLYLTYALQQTLDLLGGAAGVELPSAAAVQQQLDEAVKSNDRSKIDQALTTFGQQKHRPEIGNDPNINLLVARAAGKRIKLDTTIKATDRTQLHADLLAALAKAMANPQIKEKAKADTALRAEFQGLESIKSEVEKEFQ